MLRRPSRRCARRAARWRRGGRVVVVDHGSGVGDDAGVERLCVVDHRERRTGHGAQRVNLGVTGDPVAGQHDDRPAGVVQPSGGMEGGDGLAGARSAGEGGVPRCLEPRGQGCGVRQLRAGVEVCRPEPVAVQGCAERAASVEDDVPPAQVALSGRRPATNAPAASSAVVGAPSPPDAERLVGRPRGLRRHVGLVRTGHPALMRQQCRTV